MSTPHLVANQQKYETYKTAIAGARLPLALLDLGELESNAMFLLANSGNLPIRVASKSIRSTAILKKILEMSTRYQGVMAYSAAEAAFLAESGVDDILIGYPTLETQDINLALAQVARGKSITFMICEMGQAILLGKLASLQKLQASVCVDLDQAMPCPGLYFGVRRSSLKSPDKIAAFVADLAKMEGIKFAGFMGYDAQIAGVGDAKPGAFLENVVVTLLKKISMRSLRGQRSEILNAVGKLGFTPTLFNGGGTGSLAASKDDPSLTELTAGSGFYAPTLFDNYQNLNLSPALMFALPVTRKNENKWITCHGGGFIASGSAGSGRLPKPYLPGRLRLFPHEGAGEVQTPLAGDIENIKLGDPIFFRHAKAGELCEHFNEILLVKNGLLCGTAKTYRGAGRVFL